MSTHALASLLTSRGLPPLTRPRYRRRIIFTSTPVLIGMFLLAVELQWISQAQQQFRAIKIINGLGGRVQYAWRLAPEMKDIYYSSHQKHCFVFPGDSVVVGVRLDACQLPNLDEKLAGLSLLKHAKRVSLAGSRVSDAVLTEVGDLAALEYLDLSNTLVSDMGVGILARINSLERLNLAQTSITDQSLSTLGGLWQLKWLNVRHTGVTSAGLQVLRTRRPGLQIENDFDDIAASPFVAGDAPWNSELFRWLANPIQPL